MKKKKSKNQFEFFFYNFKNVLKQVGFDITTSGYDNLKIPRPSRRHLENISGLTFTELKNKAYEELNVKNADETYKHLIQRNRSLMERLNRQKDLNQVFVETCLGSISALSFKPLTPPKKETTKENLDFHIMRSDAHVGENLDSKYVQGINKYNSKIYKERVNILLEKVIKFREQDKNSLGLNKLIINFLGDQCTGENIYKGQGFYIDMSMVDQLFYSVEVETNWVLGLAKVFPEIEIYCCVGNHGRPGRKGENHVRTNFDYIFYKSLQASLKNQPHIKIFVSESPAMIVKHGTKNFLLNHGDNTKGWMGIPYYGVDRMFRKLSSLYNMIIDYELLGHYHQPSNISDMILMNGSLVGGSELSINKMGLSNPASQKIFYFHPVHGINRESNILLSNGSKLTMDENNIFTPYE